MPSLTWGTNCSYGSLATFFNLLLTVHPHQGSHA